MCVYCSFIFIFLWSTMRHLHYINAGLLLLFMNTPFQPSPYTALNLRKTVVSQDQRSGVYAGLILGRCGFENKNGGRGVTPSKTHHFGPICKQHYDNFGQFSWLCWFFPSFFLNFFSDWLLPSTYMPDRGSHPIIC